MNWAAFLAVIGTVALGMGLVGTVAASENRNSPKHWFWLTAFGTICLAFAFGLTA